MFITIQRRKFNSNYRFNVRLSLSDFLRRTFGKKGPTGNAARSFVQFILEPLYKILAHVSNHFQSILEKKYIIS